MSKGNKTDRYLSLYDYLGKAAGPQLGKEVFSKSKLSGIKVKTREVSNPKYTGTIILYPESFLNIYFNKSKSNNA